MSFSTPTGSGIACGALIVHFAKLRGRKLAGFITIVLAALILGTPAFLLSCTSIDIAGVTVPYINGWVFIYCIHSVVDWYGGIAFIIHDGICVLLLYCANFRVILFSEYSKKTRNLKSLNKHTYTVLLSIRENRIANTLLCTLSRKLNHSKITRYTVATMCPVVTLN